MLPGFAGVQAQPVEIVFMDSARDDEKEAPGRIGEVEVGIFGGRKANLGHAHPFKGVQGQIGLATDGF
jgi:hypothetical protein